MSQPVPPAVPAAPPVQEPAPAAPVVETPPWGTDFDQEKAWALVQNLRSDKEKLAQRPVLTPEQQKQLGEYNALVEASKSEQQRQAEAVEAAKRDAESARAEAIRYKAAATHGITADHFDLLGSGTEEEILARAEKIAALTAAQVAPPQIPAPKPPARPLEQLRPGATPAGVVDEDETVYAALFGPPT